jgi:DNA-binding transcriptional MerR regulator
VKDPRLLSIGEFAAATQLSLKALRLYDEQRILRPEKIDPTSGYRYYRREQVPLGRLIRTLRAMSLPLANIAQLADADGPTAERLLSRFAGEIDLRYAREKRAWQQALLQLRGAGCDETLAVEDRTRPGMTVVVRRFLADRVHLIERLRAQMAGARAELQQLRVQVLESAWCRFIEPLSDEEVQMELLLPVAAPRTVPRELTFWQLPPARCAAVPADPDGLQRGDITAAFDELFDWLDRNGHRAIDVPWLSLTDQCAGSSAELLWAYEPRSGSAR